MKKTFSEAKYLEQTGKKEIKPAIWPSYCIGKEVINGMIDLFIIHDDWCDIEYDEPCSYCGEYTALKPYGKDGAMICGACAAMNPEETAYQLTMQFDNVMEAMEVATAVAAIQDNIKRGVSNEYSD